MWWDHNWPAPWMMFFGPMMMFFLVMACMVAMFFMMRMGPMRRSQAGACSFGFGRLGQHVGLPESGHSAFEEYRAEALQRLDEEQREFQEFIAHLRMAKDKAEFEQFMTERRNRSSQT
jgi:hypothetical protein